jgi:hypothetical protein
MKKISILFTLVVLLAMIPLTYVIGRGGHRGGGRGGYSRHSGYRHGGHYRHGGGYYRRGYGYGWTIPAVVGGVALGAALASSSDNSSNDTTYYPEENYTNDEYLIDESAPAIK